jgi:hypothetical protein
MIHKTVYAEVTDMWVYALGGAAVGVIIGHLFPPGYLFWFAAGAVSGCVAQRYLARRY